jgi:aspartyl-tRNA(Asn)/glutamyl-tRNA(Gln) amidotransferase subunit B
MLALLNPSRAKHSSQTLLLQCRRLSWKVDPVSGIVSLNNKAVYQTIIGLEVHAQLQVSTKLFSPTPFLHTNSLLAQPNSVITPLAIAVPGYLPILSIECLQAAVRASAALDCTVHPVSRFERKHYAYADLPLGYQITQQRWPLATKGKISALYSTGKKRKQDSSAKCDCRINRVQLEQDTGKTITTTVNSTSANSVNNHNNNNNSNGAKNADGGYSKSFSTQVSRVDFNRAGSALIEIVTEPDIRSSRQAIAIFEAIRQILQYIDVCDGRMDQGSLRCDLNVNLERIESDDGRNMRPRRSPRVEVKNLNSIRHIMLAAEHEVTRQAPLWWSHEHNTQSDESSSSSNILAAETRTWDPSRGCTLLIRRKDDEEDYRFMPEPDIPPIHLTPTSLGGLSLLDFVHQSLPELPEQAIARLQRDYGLSDYQSRVIGADAASVALLDQALSVCFAFYAQDAGYALDDYRSRSIAQTTANLLSNELFALVKDRTVERETSSGSESDHGLGASGNVSMRDCMINGAQLGELVIMILQEEVSNAMSKRIMSLLYEAENEGASPRTVAKRHGIQQISDPIVLKAKCEDVVMSHPQQVAQYHEHKKHQQQQHKAARMVTYLMGQVMASFQGNAHPERVRELLQDILDENDA